MTQVLWPLVVLVAVILAFTWAWRWAKGRDRSDIFLTQLQGLSDSYTTAANNLARRVGVLEEQAQAHADKLTELGNRVRRAG